MHHRWNNVKGPLLNSPLVLYDKDRVIFPHQAGTVGQLRFSLPVHTQGEGSQGMIAHMKEDSEEGRMVRFLHLDLFHQ